jgi:hypothetical protein
MASVEGIVMLKVQNPIAIIDDFFSILSIQYLITVQGRRGSMEGEGGGE